MPMLDLITVLCVGLMTGNELAVSLFVNPAIWKLEEAPQARALSLLAQSLGKTMPFWYFLCLLLLSGEAYVRRSDPHSHTLHAALAIWVVVIVYTITLLVPINNRISRLDIGNLSPGWRNAHKKWDVLHRGRILLLR